MTDKKLRKFKLVDKIGFINSYSSNKSSLNDHLDSEGCFCGVLHESLQSDYGLYTECLDDCLILKEEFKFFEEVVEKVVDDTKDNVSSEWDSYPPVGTECSLWTPRSGKNKDFDCKVLGYHKDSCGDSVVWVEKLSCPPHEDPFRTYLLNKVTFSKIEPKSWQEVLCDEFDIVYSGPDDTFNFERKYSSNGIIKLAKRIIELSDPKED